MQASAYFGVAVLCQQIVTVRCLPDTQTFELKCKHRAALWFSSFLVFSLQKNCKKALDGSLVL